MDDDFGDDVDLANLASAYDRPSPAAPSNSNPSDGPKIQQPKPQALPSRTGPSAILVSTRQKGNPSLNYIKNVPWEYGDIPCDYVLGATTCALFLSLKYHRLHPEYVYSRIRALGKNYNLRILLCLVDIQNHEESLKELSKTSLINNLTLMLCWSAQEAGRYLELYKSYEYASPQSIRAHQATSYSDKLVEFVTVPRSVNKTDAISLVTRFGSVRAAVNARPEEIAELTGWGEKKVQRWYESVREPFRVKKAAKRVGMPMGESSADLEREDSLFIEEGGPGGPETAARTAAAEVIPIGRVPPQREASGLGSAAAANEDRARKRPAPEILSWEPGENEEEALFLAAAEHEATPSRSNGSAKVASTSTATARPSSEPAEEVLGDGVAAALAKLRKT